MGTPIVPGLLPRPIGGAKLGYETAEEVVCAESGHVILLGVRTLEGFGAAVEYDVCVCCVCAVEQLLNFDNAHRFAKDHDGRIFLVHYADLANEMVLWGDRPREKMTVSFRKAKTGPTSQFGSYVGPSPRKGLHLSAFFCNRDFVVLP